MALKQIIDKKDKAKALLIGEDAATERQPLVCLFFEKETPKDIDSVIDGLETLGVRLAIVGHPKGCTHEISTTFCNVSEKEALAAADITICFTKENVLISRKNAAVPVAPYMDESITINYNPVQEKGNGFYFNKETKWDIFAAIVRALETYQFPYDWQNLIKELTK